MKLFFIFLMILLIFFIPIPIKFNIYYSTINYYLKLYGLTIISKKKSSHKIKDHKIDFSIKKEHKFFSSFYKNIDLKSIDFKSLISTLFNLKFKPLLKVKSSLDYSLNDAARTAIFYGILYQTPLLIYFFMNIPFKTYKFSFKINPIFEDKFLLKIETSSIIFISFANIIYIIIILLKFIKKAKEATP
ncbi:MAG: DUF2953 domain-containing protein [Clostridium sp.]|uniref:DUF2953 domain-containing protein n=1 Tax=Clostridium sp. TaxID=1506 RepID=UPI0025B98A4D|nr:DUF2953 domain-containing protein [Clostridium sp.]MCE5220997.1 DUF2953 domain-containing protein [Clostridium sp.]